MSQTIARPSTFPPPVCLRRHGVLDDRMKSTHCTRCFSLSSRKNKRRPMSDIVRLGTLPRPVKSRGCAKFHLFIITPTLITPGPSTSELKAPHCISLVLVCCPLLDQLLFVTVYFSSPRQYSRQESFRFSARHM